MGSRRVRFLLLVCGALSVLSCTSQKAKRQEALGAEEEKVYAPPPWLTVATPPEVLRVYVDVSGSMRGFVSDDGHYANALQRIRDIALRLAIPRVTYAPFSGSLGRQQSLDYFLRATSYSESETNLTLPFDSTSTHVRTDDFLVITDSVASLGKAISHPTTRDNLMPDCETGNDLACVAGSVLNYIQAGGYVWLVGAKLPFSGTYYIEQGARRGEPLNVTGVTRPLYVWVGSRNANFGRELTKAVADFIEMGGSSVESLELAPGACMAWSPRVPIDAGKLQSGRCAKLPGQRPKLAGIVTAAEDATPPLVKVRLRVPQGHMCLKLPVVPDGTVWSGPSLVRRHQDWTLVGGSSGARLGVEIQAEDDPTIWINLEFSRGGIREGGVTIASTWSIAETGSGGWWEEWSTDRDDSVEEAGRTLNLSLLLSNLASRLGPASAGAPVLTEYDAAWLNLVFYK